MNELKGIPHRFVLLVPKLLLYGRVPFQSNPCQFFLNVFRESIFQNSLSNKFISNFNFTFVSLKATGAEI